MVITFESGRTVEDVYGPFTTEPKAKEITTRMKRCYNSLLTRRRQNNGPNYTVRSIRYIRELCPGYGWYPQTDEEYTP